MNIDVTKAMPYTSGGIDWALVGPESLATWAANDIRIRLTMFLGQYEFDTGAGVDWLKLFDARDMRIVQEGIRRCIQSCPAVRRLDSIETSLNPSTRRLDVTFFARLSDGTTLDQTETL